MKFIITEDLYRKIGIVNGTIGCSKHFNQKKRLDSLQWIDAPMHEHFGRFYWVHRKKRYITKHNSQGLTKKCGDYSPITRNFQNHHYGEESSTSKTFNINRYQVPLAPTFCLIDSKSQRQTFDCLIIHFHQSLDIVQLNMHNIYVTLSHLHSLDNLWFYEISLYKTYIKLI
jgi:hypothetical protein